MKAVKVDSAHRVRLPSLTPGDLYEPQFGPDMVTLRRVAPMRRNARLERDRKTGLVYLDVEISYEDAEAAALAPPPPVPL
jgi:hypothetical protein